MLVDVVSDAVNDTLDPFGEYRVSELDGRDLISRGDEPLRCQRCGHLFEGVKAWSELFAHQGTPCEPPEVPESPHPVRVSFAAERATPHVRRVMAAANLTLELERVSCGDDGHDAKERSAFVVDLSILQRRLQELAYAEASCYNIEQWYEALREHTSETYTVHLSEEDLEVLRKLHAAWHVGSHCVENEILQRHAALECRVQDAVWGSSQDRFFVKTSMRSPKDAANVEHAHSDPAHVRLRREIMACCVTDAPAAVELLIKSKRVMIDIANFLRCRSAASLPLNLILRRWDDSVANSVEWRCFVADGRLTAISQYHCYTALPDLAGESQEDTSRRLRVARDRIREFQEGVHAAVAGCIGACSYVLDVATGVDADVDEKVRLVEINPMHSSGAALFSWRHDRDLLLGGREDERVELRVVGRVLG